jgi:hypothetical protein
MIGAYSHRNFIMTQMKSWIRCKISKNDFHFGRVPSVRMPLGGLNDESQANISPNDRVISKKSPLMASAALVV